MVDDGVHGAEPWSSDGTLAGTRLLKDVHPGGGGSFVPMFERVDAFVRANGHLYFATEGLRPQIWRTDGTAEGTVRVADLPGAVAKLTAVGPALFFTASDPSHGRELWTSDGTEAGTHLAADLTPGPLSTAGIGPIVDFQGQAWFVVDHGDVQDKVLYRSDGTERGTVEIFRSAEELSLKTLGRRLLLATPHDLLRVDGEDIRPLQAFNRARHLDPGSLTVLHDRALFALRYTIGKSDLWITDGTPEGTSLIHHLDGSIQARNMRVAGGRIHFGVSRGEGTELWTSDGTPSGTTRVTRLPVVTTPFLAGTSRCLFFEMWDERRYFWVSDGTAAGTGPLTSFEFPSVSLGGRYPDWGLLDQIQVVDGKLFFLAVAPFDPRRRLWAKLWTTDGTEVGTHLVRTFP